MKNTFNFTLKSKLSNILLDKPYKKNKDLSNNQNIEKNFNIEGKNKEQYKFNKYNENIKYKLFNNENKEYLEEKIKAKKILMI